jgi:putative membrane protein
MSQAPPSEPVLLCSLVGGGLILSGIAPIDRFTWVLEALPVLVGIPLLIATRSSFALTPLLYRLLAFHAGILMLGAHYTYAQVPLGQWLQDVFGFSRNHFDRIGHFAQGFVPAILTREILLRRSPLQAGKWLFFLVCSVCLAFSAAYELFEWGVARWMGEAASAFLGTQGDEWDTQWDMFLALIGSVLGQALLSKTHDRHLGVETKITSRAT